MQSLISSKTLTFKIKNSVLTKKKKKSRIQRTKSKTRTGALEHEGDGVAAIVGLEGDDVVVAGALEHLGHVVEVHSHGKIAVAAVVLEALGSEEQSHQRHVAGVHGLEREPRGRAVEVRIVH